ncbi:MAG: glycosyltransferase [Alphaproteobacteria bacterium]|nr:glycosyltransferase [Alphaproteobacteria bacterium]
MDAQHIIVIVFAHNEEKRIGLCLASLPLNAPNIRIHLLVNGSNDKTADIARTVSASNLVVHDWPDGGKARSWNRVMHDIPDLEATHYIFVDGDTVVRPGAVAALVSGLDQHLQANAASGLPSSGRKAAQYRAEMIASHGLFGALYALSGPFVARLRRSGLRLPEDLIGDDGLIGALAKTNLQSEHDWRNERVIICSKAEFDTELVKLSDPASWRMQSRRMVNYAVRHFQNRIISHIMRDTGPGGLPKRMDEIYDVWLGGFVPRRHPLWWWFDWQALKRMRNAAHQQRLKSE